MFDTIIFSKDRAAQLDLLLRSMKENCNLFKPRVLYDTSNLMFQEGYSQVRKLHPDVHFIQEMRIGQDIRRLLESGKSPYVCVLTDDTVFYRDCKLSKKTIKEVFTKKFFCFSFRLGKNTIIQDYTTGKRQMKLVPSTVIVAEENILGWNAKRYPSFDNYGYLFGCDGCMYHKDLLLEVTQEVEINNLRRS
jgi:hypothetical protein